MKTTRFLSLMLALGSAQAAPRHVVIVLGPNIPPALHETINSRIESAMSSGEPGTQVTVFSGDTYQTLSSVTLTDSREFLQLSRNTPAIRPVLLNVLRSTNAHATLSVPRVLDEISRQIRPVNGSILLIGDAYPCLPSEDVCLSTNWPADMHFREATSVFNTLERGHQLESTAVHWLVTDSNRSGSDRHRRGMERFYSLFVANQSGALVTFTPDVTTAFRSAFSGRRDPFLQVTMNPSDTNRLFHWVGEPPVEMKASTTIRTQIVEEIVVKTVTNWVEEVRRVPSPWPAVPLGKTGIGVLWTTPPGESRFVDVDLHVPILKEGVELSWKNRTAKTGRYFRDIQKSETNPSPDWKNSWEFVELDSPELPEAVYLNRYAGSAAVTGEVRIEHDGRIQVIAFVLPAGPGNKGGDTTRRDRSPQWLRIDLRSVVFGSTAAQ